MQLGLKPKPRLANHSLILKRENTNHTSVRREKKPLYVLLIIAGKLRTSVGATSWCCHTAVWAIGRISGL